MKLQKSSWSWIFNRLLLCGVVLGWWFTSAYDRYVETSNHKGSGIVTYSDGERPDRDETVSESKYKQHNYYEIQLMVAMGMFAWGIVAWIAKSNEAKFRTEQIYLEKQIHTLSRYHEAFASAIGDATRSRADKIAIASKSYLESKAAENIAMYEYYAARAKTDDSIAEYRT